MVRNTNPTSILWLPSLIHCSPVVISSFGEFIILLSPSDSLFFSPVKSYIFISLCRGIFLPNSRQYVISTRIRQFPFIYLFFFYIYQQSVIPIHRELSPYPHQQIFRSDTAVRFHCAKYVFTTYTRQSISHNRLTVIS
jgi:hypothetical protein